VAISVDGRRRTVELSTSVLVRRTLARSGQATSRLALTRGPRGRSVFNPWLVGIAVVVRAAERSRTPEFMHVLVYSDATLSGSNGAEVAPATGFARNAASLEAMAGQIYPVVVMARLVGLYATPPPRDTAGVSKT
jgi:hypothetical protein